MAAKEYVYRCLFCDGTVTSKLRTGQIDHRGMCGKRFEVENGVVSKATKRHSHRCPLCQTLVWSALRPGESKARTIHHLDGRVSGKVE